MKYISRKRLAELFARYDSLRIALAGDVFLDRWYEIDEALNEPSLETGLTAYQIVKKRSAPGAGGTVLNNLSEMGVGKLEVITIVGDDGDGWEVCKRMNERRIDTSNVIVSDRIVTPAYIKPLFPVEGNRFDIKNFKPTPEDIQDELIRRIEDALRRNDALILLDQICEADFGVLTERVREAACQLAKKYPDKLIFADSRAFIDRFHDVVIKCNCLEAARMTGREAVEEIFDRDEVFTCMDELRAKNRKPVVVTCNKHGVAVDTEHGKELVPAVLHKGPIDICGAGDACTAGLVTALCAGASYAEAAAIGNLSSGVTVRMLGQTGAASRDAMLALYDEQYGAE